MNRHLLDANVLLALVWPRHESRDAAHAWFAKSGHKAWATSPLTQLGVFVLRRTERPFRGSRFTGKGAVSAMAKEVVKLLARYLGTHS